MSLLPEEALNPKEQKLSHRLGMRRVLPRLGGAAVVLAGAGLAVGLVAQASLAKDDRAQWVDHAARGYHNAKAFCANREVINLRNEAPPMVQFYLNQEGVLRNAYLAWETEETDQRLVYQLNVQFNEFDDETLTRIAELDQRIDDGNLFEGQVKLSLCGFTCALPGPALAPEKFAGDYQADSAVNPI